MSGKHANCYHSPALSTSKRRKRYGFEGLRNRKHSNRNQTCATLLSRLTPHANAITDPSLRTKTRIPSSIKCLALSLARSLHRPCASPPFVYSPRGIVHTSPWTSPLSRSHERSSLRERVNERTRSKSLEMTGRVSRSLYAHRDGRITEASIVFAVPDVVGIGYGKYGSKLFVSRREVPRAPVQVEIRCRQSE